MPDLYGKRQNRFIQVPLDTAACGTSANYRGHHRRGEKPCKACREANSRYRADYERKRSQKGSQGR